MLPLASILDRVPTVALAELSPLHAVAGLVVAATALRLLRFATHKRLAHDANVHEPPLPKSTHWLVGNTRELIKHNHRLYDWLTDLSLEFNGQPFRIEAYGLGYTVMLTSPRHVEAVLKTHFDNFEKGAFVNEVLQDLAGQGIFASDGETWFHQRKTASHLFTMRALRDSMTSLVHKHLARLIETLDASAANNTAFDMAASLHDFTLRAFTDMAFGVDLSAIHERDDPQWRAFPAAFNAAQRRLSFRLSVPRALWKFQRYWNLAGEATFKQHIKTIHTIVLDVIGKSLAQRQQAGSDTSRATPNLVSLFLDSFEHETTGEKFDPTYLRDFVVNIMVAGRDTTAQTLAWFFYCLAEHPHVLQKIRDEITRLTPELLMTDNGFASMEQVAKLVYLDATIKETLRLYPAVPLNIRAAVKDTVLDDGTLLKKGVRIGLPTYAMGRMPHVWGPNATAFDPDRWFDAKSGEPRVISAFQFNSFHAGPRQCIGQKLAMLEMKIAAVALLTRFELVVEPGQTVTYGRSLTLTMKNPFMVHAERRNV
jgi:cytochrome P450